MNTMSLPQNGLTSFYTSLNGYFKHHRHSHLIAYNMRLGDSEYRLWDLLKAGARWDDNRQRTLRKLEGTLTEFGAILGWHVSKTSRMMSSLMAKKLITRIGRSTYEVLIGADYKLNETEFAQVQEQLAYMQNKLAPVQTTQEKNAISPLVSFRGNSSVYPKKVVICQEPRSDEEYQRIYKEGPYQGLIPDDMRWIDENIVEVRSVPDEATEADYVEIFFDGDWDLYRKNLSYSQS